MYMYTFKAKHNFCFNFSLSCTHTHEKLQIAGKTPTNSAIIYYEPNG